MTLTKNIWRYAALFSAIFLLDRITKYYMIRLTEPYSINKILSFCLSINRGIAWSLFNSKSSWVFILVTFLILLFIGVLGVYTFVRYLNHYSVVGEVLVLAGALSNVLDRFIYSGVIDFIVVSYQGWTWPSFNIADAAVVIGVFIMFMQGYRE